MCHFFVHQQDLILSKVFTPEGKKQQDKDVALVALVG
jgi:hypothetical protein